MDELTENPSSIHILDLNHESHSNWINPIHKITAQVPGSVLIGSSALYLQLASRNPDLASSMDNSQGPNDLDIISSSDSFSKLRDSMPIPENQDQSATFNGYVRKRAVMPDSYYLALNDISSIPAKSLHVDVILEGSGPKIETEEIILNGKSIKVPIPEELLLHRLFQLAGYERSGREDKIEAPKNYHYDYMKINQTITSDEKLDILFPKFKERMKAQRGIEITELTWKELETRVNQSTPEKAD